MALINHSLFKWAIHFDYDHDRLFHPWLLSGPGEVNIGAFLDEENAQKVADLCNQGEAFKRIISILQASDTDEDL